MDGVLILIAERSGKYFKVEETWRIFKIVEIINFVWIFMIYHKKIILLN